MKKLISLGILISLLGGCNLNTSTSNKESSKTSSNVVISSSSKEESSSNKESSSKVSSTTSSSSVSSSTVIEEKTLVINPSNFNKLSEIELKDVVENTQYPQEFTFNSLGYLRTNKIKGLKKLEMRVYSTYENLKVFESYEGKGTALKSNKVTGDNEATYTYDLSGGNELYILNDTADHRTHVYEIKITYTGVNGVTGGNNSSSSNKDSSSFTSEDSSSSSYIESDWYEGNYYDNANLDLSDNALLLELRDLTTTTHTTIIKYNSLNNILYITDRSLTDSSKITLLYNHKDVNGTWDSGNTYNKEHVWPQSTGWDKSQTAGADVHHLRPEDPTLNSTRGNTPYGEVTNGKEAKMKTGEGSGCYYGGGYFEPKDVSKGDVARIIFYLLTRYSDADSKSITGVAQSMELLLEWNELDPVDDLERQRNKEGEKKQGNRNPFIDYPELANKIWG